MSLSTYDLQNGRHRCRHCSRAYTPSSNTANHEKINSWVSFTFLWVWGSAWRPLASGAPLIITLASRKDTDIPIDQSRCKVLRVTKVIGFGFTSEWRKKWHKLFKEIVWCCNEKTIII